MGKKIETISKKLASTRAEKEFTYLKGSYLSKLKNVRGIAAHLEKNLSLAQNEAFAILEGKLLSNVPEEEMVNDGEVTEQAKVLQRRERECVKFVREHDPSEFIRKREAKPENSPTLKINPLLGLIDSYSEELEHYLVEEKGFEFSQRKRSKQVKQWLNHIASGCGAATSICLSSSSNRGTLPMIEKALQQYIKHSKTDRRAREHWPIVIDILLGFGAELPTLKEYELPRQHYDLKIKEVFKADWGLLGNKLTALEPRTPFAIKLQAKLIKYIQAKQKSVVEDTFSQYSWPFKHADSYTSRRYETVDQELLVWLVEAIETLDDDILIGKVRDLATTGKWVTSNWAWRGNCGLKTLLRELVKTHDKRRLDPQDEKRFGFVTFSRLEQAHGEMHCRRADAEAKEKLKERQRADTEAKEKLQERALRIASDQKLDTAEREIARLKAQLAAAQGNNARVERHESTEQKHSDRDEETGVDESYRGQSGNTRPTQFFKPVPSDQDGEQRLSHSSSTGGQKTRATAPRNGESHIELSQLGRQNKS